MRQSAGEVIHCPIMGPLPRHQPSWRPASCCDCKSELQVGDCVEYKSPPGYPSVILAVRLCHASLGPPEGGHRLVRDRDPDCFLPIHRRQLSLYRFVLLGQAVRSGNSPLTQVRGNPMPFFDCNVWVQGAYPAPGTAGDGPGASATGSRSGTGIAN